jgi:RNA polymerase sigma factor (sigma-70 family)
MRLGGDVQALLLQAVAEDLETQQSGEAREHILRTIAETASVLLEDQLRALSTELSQRVNIPAAALRTQAGWEAMLERLGHDRDAVGNVGDLPGTVEILLLREIMQAAQGRHKAVSGGLYNELGKYWSRVRTAEKNFDAVISSNREHTELVYRIGWALINLEGLRHVKLVWHQANKLEKSFPDREASELLTWGWLGLRTALRHYNPRLGFAFSTYACTRIVGSIRDGVRAENPVPKRLATIARRVGAVELDLVQKLGRPPTMEEVSREAGIEIAQLQVVRRTKTAASIEEIVAGTERAGNNEPAWLAADSNLENDVMAADTARAVAEAMAQLPAEEAEAIRLLILEERNPTEAKGLAGVTARQLRQRKERGLSTLRDLLAEQDS